MAPIESFNARVFPIKAEPRRLCRPGMGHGVSCAPLQHCLVGQGRAGSARVKGWGLGINYHLPSSSDLRWILNVFVCGGLFSSRLIG